jgi:beta-1,3-galactosyltransferase / beta-1,3-N-acetylglucosaminyltransferase
MKISESTIDNLYAGFVFPYSSPMRHLISKWYISLNDYPYHKFPAYVSAGCYILSKRSAQKLYLASKLTKVI